MTYDCCERTSPSWAGTVEDIITRLNLFALLLSHIAQSSDPRAMTPNGTPTPTPMVVSCELLDVGTVIDEFEEELDAESGGTRFARAARPVRIWASASWKLSVSSRQMVSPPLATTVPQQYVEVPLAVFRFTIADPPSLFTVPDLGVNIPVVVESTGDKIWRWVTYDNDPGIPVPIFELYSPHETKKRVDLRRDNSHSRGRRCSLRNTQWYPWPCRVRYSLPPSHRGSSMFECPTW